MTSEDVYYTITVVRHPKHPRLYTEQDSDKPSEVISATVLPPLAGDILRAAADGIAPKKPVTR